MLSSQLCSILTNVFSPLFMIDTKGLTIYVHRAFFIINGIFLGGNFTRIKVSVAPGLAKHHEHNPSKKIARVFLNFTALYNNVFH